MTPEEIAVKQHGSKAAAARALGIPVTTLKSRLAKHAPQKEPRKHLVIPDVQAKPGVGLDHLDAAGNYIAEKCPDVVVIIGDFYDFPSLSSWDKGKRSAEGRRYRDDLEAGHEALERLMVPIIKSGNIPEIHVTLGNHEHRIIRATDSDPTLYGTMGYEDLHFEKWGIKVHPFLEVVEIDGISYSHYFYNPNTGKPYAGSALTKLKNIGLSYVMGHQQGIDVAMRELPNGKTQHGLVAGSFYQHDEIYRGPQANGHWNGIVMLHEVQDGQYDLMQISLDFLRRRYL